MTPRFAGTNMRFISVVYRTSSAGVRSVPARQSRNCTVSLSLVSRSQLASRTVPMARSKSPSMPCGRRRTRMRSWCVCFDRHRLPMCVLTLGPFLGCHRQRPRCHRQDSRQPGCPPYPARLQQGPQLHQRACCGCRCPDQEVAPEPTPGHHDRLQPCVACNTRLSYIIANRLVVLQTATRPRTTATSPRSSPTSASSSSQARPTSPVL